MSETSPLLPSNNTTSGGSGSSPRATAVQSPSFSDENGANPIISRPKAKVSKFSKIVIAVALVVFSGLVAMKLLAPDQLSYFRGPPNLLSPLKLRLYTNNIRYDNHNLDPHERPWSLRKQLITSSIQFNTFNNDEGNIVCLQEVLHNQLEDILFNLNNEKEEGDWNYYGVGRTDGKFQGEYSPILYKKLEWLELETRTFWLSPTPDVPSRGWDAALERIVTMVTLQSKTNPLIKLNFFNTHFDHRGVKARRKSSQLIIDKMDNYNGYPSFLCGDFNTEPTDEPYHILKKLGFKDSRTLVDKLHHYGHDTTFSGFEKHEEVNTIIDYIWAPYFAKNGNNQTPIEDSPPEMTKLESHKNYQIVIKNFAILHNYFKFYMSDHRPVSADYEVSFSFH